MKALDWALLVSLVVAAALVAIWHFDNRNKCLVMVKPKTDVTPARYVSKFTGEYEHINKVLYCVDEKGVKHAYRRSKANVVKI